MDEEMFKCQREAWGKPPVGGSNLRSDAFAAASDAVLRNWLPDALVRQYSQPSNWQGRYQRWMDLEHANGNRILDFGCGFGLDALTYANAGAEVLLADIVRENLKVATRLLMCQGFLPQEIIEVGPHYPFFSCASIGVFHSSGVMHHTPDAKAILSRACELLWHRGEIRLMLYTDHLFRQATGQEPGSIEDDVRSHPAFRTFVRFADAVGEYADWYNQEKLDRLVSNLPLEWVSFNYLREDQGYCAAVFRRV